MMRDRESSTADARRLAPIDTLGSELNRRPSALASAAPVRRCICGSIQLPVSCLRGLRVAIFVALTATCAFGTEAQVRVRVRDGDTGQWLAGAKVRAGERVLFTDTDGAVIIPAVAGRRLILTTTLEGFFPATDTVSITASDSRVILRLYGRRPRTAIGFVKDGRTGKRLANASVRVRGDAAKARSDSTGMYAIPFPPGDRELIAALAGFRGFPRRLSVKAGDTLSVDLPLYDTSVAVGEVEGRVEVQGFGAAIGASVTVEGTRLGTASDRNGDYILTGVPAGPHRLIFTYAGCKKTMRIVTVEAWKSLTQNVRMVPARP